MHWKVNDTQRDALVYIPAAAKNKPTPIIFAFHGHGGTMENMMNSRDFEKLWPEAIIVYPQGLNTPGQITDPKGARAGWQKAPGDMSDRDLKFFDSMLTTFKNDYQIDGKRIYATGHSNGGSFTYILWATRSNVFAAFAPSSAAALKLVNQLTPKPALHIIGDNDPLVKPAWQKLMYNNVMRINNSSKAGENYAKYATLYPSPTGTPFVLYEHPGGHVYPQEANEVVIQFFKSCAKN